MNEIKYSIIITTYNHAEDLLKPCLEAIIKHTNLDNVEIIIVANGCKDNTREVVESFNNSSIKLLWFDDALGYSKANNIGIRESIGEYVVLLNNDAFLLEQPKNSWLNRLVAPFLDPSRNVGLSGPLKILSPPAGHYFIIFFCVMIKREVFDKIGLLNEIYGKGGGEDTEFSIEAERLGYELASVCDISWSEEQMIHISDYPIYHRGEGTVHDKNLVPDWDDVFQRNSIILAEKYNPDWLIKNEPTPIAYICTKGRYDTTLPLTLSAVINQTLKPSHIILYDDNIPDVKRDIREDEIYLNLFKIMNTKGITWEIVYGINHGQHHGHQYVNERNKNSLLWRVDDDCIPEPNVLETLYGFANMHPEVGAVGGEINVPNWNLNQLDAITASNKMEDIFRKPNKQWFNIKETEEVDHLHCSFLYRGGIADYNLNLSRVAHREETLFSYAIKQSGYKVLIVPNAKTWHLKAAEGGIRTDNNDSDYKHDDEIFFRSLDYGKIFYLDSGLGDHIVFSTLLPEIKLKYNKITIAPCYKEVFEDENCITLDIGKLLINPEDHNIYKFMAENNWQGDLESAYRKIYDINPL